MISWITSNSKWGWTPSSLSIFHARLSAMVCFMVSVELCACRAARKAIFRRHALACRQSGWSREGILAGQVQYYQDMIEELEREFRGQIYEELADTVARTRTVVAATDRGALSVMGDGIQERMWERWADLMGTIDRLALADCDAGGGGEATSGQVEIWILQAENNGRLQTTSSVEAAEVSWLGHEDEQAGKSVNRE